MSEAANIQFIKDHFTAFGQGDIQKALGMIAEDVDWQSPVTRSAYVHLPWAKSYHSRNQVKDFFQMLNEFVQTEKFEFTGFIAQGDQVVVEGRNKGMVRATQRHYEHDWIMVFTIKDSQIIRHRHYYDTGDLLSAFEE